MKLITKLIGRGPNTTLSQLYINGTSECYILEDTDRGLSHRMTVKEIQAIKIHGRTAIPSGRYDVLITMSPRFKRLLPLLMDVPGFAGIRIHPGNKHQDTEGCLLPGNAWYQISNGDYVVTNSRMAFDVLFQKIRKAETKNELITINIRAQQP